MVIINKTPIDVILSYKDKSIKFSCGGEILDPIKVFQLIRANVYFIEIEENKVEIISDPTFNPQSNFMPLPPPVTHTTSIAVRLKLTDKHFDVDSFLGGGK
jgi:hypothetical protein